MRCKQSSGTGVWDVDASRSTRFCGWGTHCMKQLGSRSATWMAVRSCWRHISALTSCAGSDVDHRLHLHCGLPPQVCCLVLRSAKPRRSAGRGPHLRGVVYCLRCVVQVHARILPWHRGLCVRMSCMRRRVGSIFCSVDSLEQTLCRSGHLHACARTRCACACCDG